jgi:hypothetical protein
VCITAQGPDGPLTWAINIALNSSGVGAVPTRDPGATVALPEAVLAPDLSSARGAPGVDSAGAAGAGSQGRPLGGVVHYCCGRMIHAAAARARIADLEVEGEAGRAEAEALACRWVGSLAMLPCTHTAVAAGVREL